MKQSQKSGWCPRRPALAVALCCIGAGLVLFSALPAYARSFTFQGLGDLTGGIFFSEAFGVSGDGRVVVGRGTSASGTEAFRWTQSGGMVGLGDLPGGILAGFAYGASRDGAVVVGKGTSASGTEAFRWTRSGGMVGLGDLPGGRISGEARGVSADGAVVVGQSYSASGLAAFIWDAGHGMQNLKELLTANGLDLTGWNLYNATGISADGSTIVGWGWNPSGDVEAWRVGTVVPLPGALLLLGTGLAAYARRAAGRK